MGKNRPQNERNVIRKYQQAVLQQIRASESYSGPIISANNFVDTFAPENCTVTEDPDDNGGFHEFSPESNPTTLTIYGPDDPELEESDDDVLATYDLTINGPFSGTWIFNWEYTTEDVIGADQAGYLIDGIYTKLAEAPESGNVNIEIENAETIGFRMISDNSKFGPGKVEVTNFDVIPPENPVFFANKLSEDLGLVLTSESINFNLEVTNSGGDDLELTSISLPVNITADKSTTILIAPDQSETITFTFAPNSELLTYSETISITHNASGSPFEFNVTANVLNNSVFTYEFSGLTLDSRDFVKIAEGSVVGLIDQFYPDFVIDASTDETFAKDLTILITRTPDIESERLLQIGGDIDFGANQRLNWNEGNLENRVFTPVAGSSPLNLDATTIWLGHGFEGLEEDELNPSGTWSGRIAFFDTEEATTQQFTNSRITGEGWYIFSSPKVYSTVDDLTSGLWTQCFTGASFNESTFCDNVPVGQPTRSNVITYNGTDDVWEAVASADELVLPATSVAVYVYETQDPLGTNTPTDFGSFEIELNGFPILNSYAVNIPDNEFKLLGNPYGNTIDLQNVSPGDYNNLTGIIWQLNELADGYNTYDISAPSGSFQIDTFDGFFVLSNGSNSSFTFNPSFGDTPKQQPSDPEPAFITLYLENETVSAQTSFRILDDAGPHRPGAQYLPAPNTPTISMVSHYQDDNMLMRYLPSDLHSELTIPISLNSTYNGIAALRSEFTATVPVDWEFILVDTKTGENFNLRSSGLPDINISETEGLEERFELFISPAGEELAGTGVPSDFSLNQNYPNPFNPTTTIRYELPQASDVRLDIYSIEGRQITTLQNASQPAGQYSVTFDASNLASGIYLYRLQAGNAVFTKRMILVK